MTYFSRFPTILYQKNLVVDILRRIAIKSSSKDDLGVYLTYSVQDGESAEEIADFYYGSSEYSWIIFLLNNIIDPYYDFPISEDQLFRLISDAYPNKELKLHFRTILLDLTYQSFVGTFSTNQILSQTGSDGTGKIVKWDLMKKHLYLKNVSGTFISGPHSISCTSGNATGVLNVYASPNFTVGNTLSCNSGATGKITDFDEDLQKIIVDETSTTSFVAGNIVQSNANAFSVVQSTVLNTEGTHHYVDANANIISRSSSVPETYSSDLGGPITNREYEYNRNENLREIRLLRKELLPDFLDQFEALINDGII